MAERHFYTNRLIKEKSPYLQQHAHNPVDWYAWGEEAFQAAKSQDKPIFLSIGYATCHWCHVMEKESFENVEIAQLMNHSFINVKVDREELPDVDNLYMEFAQSMMAGAAGWPLNLVLTPELQPFFAATYLPPYSSHGLMGMRELTQRMEELWTSDERAKVLAQAENIVEIFNETIHSKGLELPGEDQISLTADLIYRMADPTYGGMKGAPKFPIGYQMSFLLRYYAKKSDSRALFLVERTLDMLHRGGIYDHLGGGFSRYSVDEQWLIPHFEKMLYDNAILSQSYLETWQLTKKPLYKTVCEEIIRYILRDMTHPQGGFYSAEDADSEGLEGKFYTWTYDEIIHLLGADKGKIFCEFYGVTPEGNFEERNVLHTERSPEEFANRLHLELEEFEEQLKEQRKKLWEVREKRVHPFKDDKILSSWNGMMIHTLAKAGCAFANPIYLEAAVKAAVFIKSNLWKDNRLLRRWREGESMFAASLDEYANMIKASISLFEADCGTEWLQWAVEMTNILRDGYKEPEGAFFQTDGTDKNLILRKCQYSDGAEPSGNAIHCENLLKLYQLTGREEFLQQAEDILKAVKTFLENYPPGYIYHVMNLQWYYDRLAPTLVVSLNSKQQYERPIQSMIYENFIVHSALVWQTHDIDLEELVPFTQYQDPVNDLTTLYICHKGVCELPLTDLQEMEDALKKL